LNARSCTQNKAHLKVVDVQRSGCSVMYRFSILPVSINPIRSSVVSATNFCVLPGIKSLRLFFEFQPLPVSVK
jgi:hypothetical protein